MKRFAGNGCCDGRDVLPQDRGPPGVCRSILMAVQLCLYEGLAARGPVAERFGLAVPTTTRCSECADPALWGQMALGFRGSLNQRATGMLSRCSLASARRCVPRSGRAASRFRCGKQSPNAAAKSAEAERRALRTGSTARPGALDFRCRVAVSGPLPCLAGLGDVPGLQGGSPAKTGKPAKPRSELCREDAEPPRSTPSASDPSP